jgi:thiamine-phosphate pyrophosphorylase
LIYLITDGETTAKNFSERSLQTLRLIKKAAEAEISFIQLREKQLSAKLVFELASKAAEITKDTKTKLLVNDRADIALAAAADGVHLTSKSLSATVIRSNFPVDFIIGVSAHTLAEVEKAKLTGADFATFSPIYVTLSKAKYGAPQGIAKISEVLKTVHDFPVIALGGIDENNFSDVLRSGASGIAAIRFLNDADKLSEVVKKMRKSFYLQNS